MMKIWESYCYWKLGDNSKFFSNIAELKGSPEVSVCLERLEEIQKKKESENVRKLKWLNKGDFAIVNLCFLEYFE